MLRLWHPLQDPYHCTFRMLTILRFHPENSMSRQLLSVMDLLWLMPYFIYDIGMTRVVRREFNKLGFPKKKDSYAYLPSIQMLYRELQPLQRVALDGMVSRGLVDPDQFEKNTIELNVECVPQALLQHIDKRGNEQKAQLEFLIRIIGAMPMDGAKGIMRNLHLERGGKLR